MRLLSILLLAAMLVLPGSSASQSSSETSSAPQGEKKSQAEQKTECGTVVRPEQVKAELSRKADVTRELAAPPIGSPYYLPLTIHFVRRTNQTGGFTFEQLEVAMRNLNEKWEQVGVQFFILGFIRYVDDDQYFDIGFDSPKLDTLRTIDVVPKTINVYFTNLTRIGGLSSFPGDPIQGILLDIDIVPIHSSLFAHEVGHYFDLYHTHETKFGVQCPNNDNCGERGDRICDTPADPNLKLDDLSGKDFRVDVNCEYDDSVETPPGCTGIYDPPTDNIMSYSRPSCIWRFTAQQISRALNTLRDNDDRKKLITNGVRYVSSTAGDSDSCTYDEPCKTIQKAVAASGPEYRVYVKPGTYGSANINDKSLTYYRWGFTGVVQLVP